MMKKTRNNKVVVLPPIEASALGPFQRKARNLGIDEKVVRCLPAEWPLEVAGIEDALYAAGFVPGERLLKVAATLWKYRPN